MERRKCFDSSLLMARQIFEGFPSLDPWKESPMEKGDSRSAADTRASLDISRGGDKYTATGRFSGRLVSQEV